MSYLDYTKLPAFVAAHYAVDAHPVVDDDRSALYEGDYVDLVRFFGEDAVGPAGNETGLGKSSN
jgi:hypothetical protein